VSGMSDDSGRHADATAAEGFWLRIIFVVSGALCAAVAFLMLGPRPAAGQRLDVSALPHLNAGLNALGGVLLLLGWQRIRAGHRAQHRSCMLAAFTASAAFLVSYLLYHWQQAGPRHYGGHHRLIYFAVLVTHVLLAAVNLPISLITLRRGWVVHPRHRRLACLALPLWLYVSGSGVVVYLMLYH